MNPFRAKSFEATPNIYLTLISIIQGLALGSLADHLDFHCNGQSAGKFLIRMLMYGVAIQMIAVTWHEYANSTICFRWPLGLRDTWIPILLGLCEYLVVKNAEFSHARAFWVWLSLFVLLGFAAFINRSHHIRNAPENRDAAVRLVEQLRETKRWMGAAVAVFLAGVVPISRFGDQVSIVLALLVLANVSFGFQAVRCRKTYRVLFADEAVEELPPSATGKGVSH